MCIASVFRKTSYFNNVLDTLIIKLDKLLYLTITFYVNQFFCI